MDTNTAPELKWLATHNSLLAVKQSCKDHPQSPCSSPRKQTATEQTSQGAGIKEGKQHGIQKCRLKLDVSGQKQ